MTYLRKLARLFRRAVATVAFGQGAPQSQVRPNQAPVRRGFSHRGLALVPLLRFRHGLTVGVIVIAMSASGCTDAFSRPVDEPTVVDVVWRNGRVELADPEVALERPDGPVRVRFIKDDEVVKEYAAGSLAQARAEMERDVRNKWKDMARRPGALPETRAWAELMESLPTESAIMLMTDEERTRLLEAVEPLLAASRRDMRAEERARMLSDVRETVNALMSEVAK